MRLYLAMFGVVALLFSFAYPGSVPVPAEGVLIDYVPVQLPPSSTEKWKVGSYVFTPLADFEIDARVLLRDRYWLDASAELSPLDLTLGWGPMSDTASIKQIDFSHGSRYYYYRIRDPSVPVQVVATHSANMHMIPANDAVRADLLRIRPNEFVSIKGKLVEINTAGGFHWRSSLTREDTGMGACEVIWVEEAYYLDL